MQVIVDQKSEKTELFWLSICLVLQRDILPVQLDLPVIIDYLIERRFFFELLFWEMTSVLCTIRR
jgi:hypothetical protein